MAFRIYGFDLDGNPKTNSWMGLSRDRARMIAKILIVIGILFSLPPIVPDPTDVISIWIANKIHVCFGIDLLLSLGLTYLMGIGVFLTGIWIYPYNSRSMINGYRKKLRKELTKVKNDPVKLAIAVIVFIVILKWYMGASS